MIAQPESAGLLFNYTAYLVRMWQAGAQKPWRAYAQCVRTGEKFMFANLEDLFSFLLAQTGAAQKEIQR